MGAENPSFSFERSPEGLVMDQVFPGVSDTVGEAPDIKSGFQISPEEEVRFFGQRPLDGMQFVASEGKKETRERDMSEGMTYGVKGTINSRTGLGGLTDLEGDFDVDGFFCKSKRNKDSRSFTKHYRKGAGRSRSAI